MSKKRTISEIRKFIRKTLNESFDQHGEPYGYPKDEDEENQLEPYHGPAQIEPKNIHFNKYHILTVEDPIIPDVVKILSKKENAVKFTDKNAFDKFAREQKYFSASHSHCFYSEEEMENWRKTNKMDPDSANSVMVFETGHEPVQIWDNKHKIGYIIPSKSLKEDWGEQSNSADCMEQPQVCMSKPEQVIDPRPEM